MKILLVGAGGREHALAWKIAQSARVTRLFAAPGNPGVHRLALKSGGTASNIAIPATDIDGIVGFALEAEIDLVVVGPEAPLAAGLADRLRAQGVAVFGPTQAAARLESSKAFAKEFMHRHAIPTAAYGVFEDAGAAKAFLDRLDGPPYVLKADGLASGKGVVIAESREQAEAEIDAMLAGRFGAASKTLVVEEFMAGEEASVFALTDGESWRMLPAAQDHKRAYDNDEGPNTGGMGAYSPAPVVGPAEMRVIEEQVIAPTIKGMAGEGAPYRGVLYVGLMMTASGPKVVEYNVRFGDPEAQVLMRRIQGDIVPALAACAKGGLSEVPPLALDPRPAVTVVMAAQGYPGPVQEGSVIEGVEAADRVEGVKVFLAGAAVDAQGRLTAAGGRVLNVTAVGDTLAQAVARAYRGVETIGWPEGFFRRDIAWRALQRADAEEDSL